ncbi:MAG: multicopper oxidase domain-containing protein [Flavobacteriales bacterium]|nr:multicopper oxidase domain-containing protein [Flavobacteriales bacterium]
MLFSSAQPPLPVPPVLTGTDIQLTLQEGTWEFHPGEVVPTYGYNGDLLGPTIMLDQGQAVTLNVTNTLPDLTTTHWHGLHVSAENDGGPHSLIYPNTTWSPSFTVLDRASTFWYHPHGHGLTDYQVTMGAAGMIIVRDALEAAMELPRTYGVDDIPLILQTKAIVGGMLSVHTGLDSVIVVNGVRQPLAEVPAQVVRLRCLNGSSERTFLIGFENNMPFQVIGTDGGLLAAPVPKTRLRLMPGERVELLVDLGGLQGNSFDMMAYNSELPNGVIGAAEVGNGMATLDGYNDNALNGADFALLSFSVGAPTADPITTIPSALAPVVPYNEADVDVTRSFIFEPEGMMPMEMIEGPFLIDGALFDMEVDNEVVQLGATEIWEFTNNTMVGHPIHIHDIQFNILDRNGGPPEDWETGWKDVVFVPSMGSARVITRFDDFADPEMPYMYHCHLLMHEDEGMMGQFLVIDANAIGETGAELDKLQVWPQPFSNGSLNLRAARLNGKLDVLLRDASGRIVHAGSTSFMDGMARILPPSLAAGLYAVQVPTRDGQQYSATFIVQP